MTTLAKDTKVLFDNGFVDIVLPDGSVLSLSIEDGSEPELWRFESVDHHCFYMGDLDFRDSYFNKKELV